MADIFSRGDVLQGLSALIYIQLLLHRLSYINDNNEIAKFKSKMR